jgi:hypothetical protein
MIPEAIAGVVLASYSNLMGWVKSISGFPNVWFYLVNSGGSCVSFF